MIELIDGFESLPELCSLSLLYFLLYNDSLTATLLVNGECLLPHGVPTDLPVSHFEYILNFVCFRV